MAVSASWTGSRGSARGRVGERRVPGRRAMTEPEIPVCWSVESNEKRLDNGGNGGGKAPKFAASGDFRKDYKDACAQLRLNPHPHVLMSIDPDFRMDDPDDIEGSLQRRLDARKKAQAEQKGEEGKEDGGEGQELPPVEELRFTGLALDKATLRILSMTLPAASVSRLQFWNAGVGVDLLEDLIKMLQSTKVTSLALDDNPLPEGKEDSFLGLIGKSSPLEALSLQSCGISDEVAAALLKALSANATLKCLNLNNNKLGPKSCEALAALLTSNKTLVALNLSNNQIDDAGAAAIAQAINPTADEGKKGAKGKAPKGGGSTVVARINLSGNKIGDEGCLALLAAVEATETLQMIGLAGNPCSAETQGKIEAAVKQQADN